MLGVSMPTAAMLRRSVIQRAASGFEAHVIIYGADIPGFENVANLDELPEVGAFVVALPMKVAGGSGGPLRIVAFVPSASERF